MAVRRVDPEQAAALLSEGWTCLDVRSVAEFEAGHIPGSFNIPLFDFEPGRGLVPNTNFLAEVLENFEVGRRMVVACKSGVRSASAAAALMQAGFEAVVDLRGGLLGEVGPDGVLASAGWQPLGLPVAAGDEPGRSYRDLRRGQPR